MPAYSMKAKLANESFVQPNDVPGPGNYDNSMTTKKTAP